jgi:CheY-like chemotaxis protein
MARILLVENDQDWLGLISRALPEHDVDPARTYGEAVERLGGGMVYDIAIVDLNLNDSEEYRRRDLLGGEILQLLRKDYPSTRRIAITGMPPVSVRKKVFDRYDVDDLLLKGNMDPADVRDAVDASLRRTPAAALPGMTAQRLALREDFHSWRDGAARRLDEQLRRLRSQLQNDIRSGRADTKDGAAVTALEAELTVLESRKELLGSECSRVDAMLAEATSAEDIVVVIDEVKRQFDGVR